MVQATNDQHEVSLPVRVDIEDGSIWVNPSEYALEIVARYPTSNYGRKAVSTLMRYWIESGHVQINIRLDRFKFLANEFKKDFSR